MMPNENRCGVRGLVVTVSRCAVGDTLVNSRRNPDAEDGFAHLSSLTGSVSIVFGNKIYVEAKFCEQMIKSLTEVSLTASTRLYSYILEQIAIVD